MSTKMKVICAILLVIALYAIIWSAGRARADNNETGVTNNETGVPLPVPAPPRFHIYIVFSTPGPGGRPITIAAGDIDKPEFATKEECDKAAVGKNATALVKQMLHTLTMRTGGAMVAATVGCVDITKMGPKPKPARPGDESI